MATLTVTSNVDSGAGSLRAAIAIAQPGDTIQFNASLANQTITLTTGQLEIDKDLIIDGANTPGLTISGNKAHRVINVTNNVDFTLKNLTIADGKPNGVGAEAAGAGIRTGYLTTLTVENCEFENNHVNGYGGGAIFAGWRSKNIVINTTFQGNSSLGNEDRGGGAITIDTESSLSVTGSEFTNNMSIRGGAINAPLGTLTVENSTFTKNRATLGGAIYSLLGSLKVENSTLTNNNSTGYGGAIFTDGASAKVDGSTSGQIEIRNSRIEGNTGAGGGGALFLYVYNSSDKVIIEDSTIINNQVLEDSQGIAFGGGLRQDNGEFIIRNTTIANNRALIQGGAPPWASQGGGLWMGGNSSATIDNSTFYGNRADSTDGNGGLGGAIILHNGSNPTNINNTTIANNYAGFRGGGFEGGGSSTTLTNTLVADNISNNGGKKSNINHQTTTVFSDGGGNVQSLNPNPNDTKITAGVTLIDPKLGAFLDNGGVVQTPPLPGNPEIQAGAVPSGFPIEAKSPTAPSDLTAAVVSTSEIDLTWADKSNNETGFKIERSPDNLNWTVLTTTAANATNYRDTGLTSSTPYYYRISATNSIGDSTTVAAKATTSSSPPTKALSKTPDDVFLIEGDSGSAQLQFNLTQSNTRFVNEVGFFVVDNPSGSVNGIAPGNEGYLQAALSQAQVIFSALPGNQFPNLRSTRQLSVDVGKAIAFYLVQDSTTDTVLSDLAAGRTPTNVFFATTSANGDNFDHLQVSELGNSSFNLAWKDAVGGTDANFNDQALTVKLTTDPQVLGTGLQGGQERELIDLRDQLTGLVSAEFEVNSEAAYHNTFGFYAVDDPTGRIGNLNPGDPGYAEAAIAQRLDLAVGLPGGKLLAPFVIADGTPEEFLAKNPNNQSTQGTLAYFAYMGANPDGVDHLRLLGDNVFGFEDLFGGGDADFNDLVVQVNFA
jgi:predicted outer membrane repeat protein